MKNGYYLSTYIHIGELDNLYYLKIRHDQNMALWKLAGSNLELVHFWELERITGIKHHNKSFFNVEFAKEFINQLLSEHDLTIDDMTGIWGTPQLEKGEMYANVSDNIPYHTLSHMFSSVILDTDKFKNENIIGLALDGGPDLGVERDAIHKKYYAGCVAKKGDIHIFPIDSPGRLWTFSVGHFNMSEGTLMALGSASTSKYNFPKDDILAMNDVNNIFGADDYIKKLIKCIENIDESDERFNGWDPLFSKEENKISMIMKEVYHMSTRIVESNIDNIIREHHIIPEKTYLAVSGGFALNCPTNSYIMNKYKFKGLIAPPCVNDGGQALGIGLHEFYKGLGKKINFKFKNSYYGDWDNDMNCLYDEKQFASFVKSINEINYEQVVSDIINQPIVWFNGRGEIGPRALGNRSIIADPRRNESKDMLNIIKQREWWRPVAPIVLEDEVDLWFINAYESPYMLNTFNIRNNKLSEVPAIAHIDNSARVQTLKSESNPILYKVIKKFKEVTGVPIVCNTSLNDKGEPIINRIPEAINFALRKHINVAYINGKRIELINHDCYKEESPYVRKYSVTGVFSDEDRSDLLNKYNPLKIEKKEMIYFSEFYERVYNKVDISTEDGIKILRKFAKLYEIKNQVKLEEIF